MGNSNTDKELEKLYSELRETRSSLEKHNLYDSHSSYETNRNDLLTFFVGLLMLAGGLFMILQNIQVKSNWGSYYFYIGNFNISSGMTTLPLIAGIAMLFLMRRKIFGWVVFAIGIVIILLSVLLTTKLEWRTTNAYVFIIMFGLTAAGGAIVIRELLKNK